MARVALARRSSPLRGKYWLLPVLTAAAWLIDLLGLLALWAQEGYPRYRPWLGQLVYISNIAAATPRQHAFFMVFSVATALLYMATIFMICHLRRRRFIPAPKLAISVWCERVSVACTCAGCLTLIILSVMDATNYPSFHWSCTISFIVFICVAVFFQCCELFSLAYSHRLRSRRVFHMLVWTASFKLFVLLASIVLAFTFAVMYLRCDGDARKDWHPDCERSLNLSAAAEWAIAFLFFFYFFSHVADMWDTRHQLDPNEAYRQPITPIDTLDTDDEDDDDDDGYDGFDGYDGYGQNLDPNSTPLETPLSWSNKNSYASVPLGSDDSLDNVDAHDAHPSARDKRDMRGAASLPSSSHSA